MQEMITKSVDVLGDAIMATKDADGIIWAGVSYFCNALGMTRGQKNRQIKNAQDDDTLKRGCTKLGAGVLDAGNETIALRLDFIPLWLAKISITDKTKKENPNMAKKLLDYQLKAKDILAEAFLPKQELPTSVAGQIQLFTYKIFKIILDFLSSKYYYEFVELKKRGDERVSTNRQAESR